MQQFRDQYPTKSFKTFITIKQERAMNKYDEIEKINKMQQS